MRVLFREDGELVLKEVDVVTVSKDRVLLEATTGDTRIHVQVHSSWTTADVEAVLRQQATGTVIDLEVLSGPR